ncbi:MAG: HD domain-containing protein [candidate division Zixibacteria bacterium]
MEHKYFKKRLDEILIGENLVTDREIKEALDRQREFGGKLGTHLYHLGHIDEKNLVRALSLQLNCDGVVLSLIDIHKMVITMIPQNVAMSRLVMPFDYKPEDNLLKIACLDPTDPHLVRELKFVSRGKNIKLYLATEASIILAINKYYLNRQISIGEAMALGIKNAVTDDDTVTDFRRTRKSNEHTESDKRVLLVSDDEKSNRILKRLLEYDAFDIMTTNSADKAIDILDNDEYACVLIKDTVPGDYIDLIDRVRKISTKTIVQFFDSPSKLILNPESWHLPSINGPNPLEILTSLLSSLSQLNINHSGRVGTYVEKLCEKMRLPAKDRILISTAGYMHDLARFYYRTESSEDNRRVVSLTAKLLSSLGFDPAVVGILKSMYLDLEKKYTSRLPIETLGGNILTIIDLFTESIPRDEYLSLDKFDDVKESLRDMAGRLFLPEVLEAFIEMMQIEILLIHERNENGQIMIYTEDLTAHSPLEMRLKYDGFRTIIVNSVETFVSLYRRSMPDAIVLVVPGKPDDITLLTANLYNHDINLKHLPVYVLTNPESINHLTILLDQGIEDIISIEDNLDLLMTKLHQLKANPEEPEPDNQVRQKTNLNTTA